MSIKKRKLSCRRSRPKFRRQNKQRLLRCSPGIAKHEIPVCSVSYLRYESQYCGGIKLKILSLSEFRTFCGEICPREYIYDTANQPRENVDGTLNVSARYHTMLISMHPNAICFKNDSSFICFEDVKKVRIELESDQIGTVFTILCGNTDNDACSKSYRILAD